MKPVKIARKQADFNFLAQDIKASDVPKLNNLLGASKVSKLQSKN